jgi:hypothetical protein
MSIFRNQRGTTAMEFALMATPVLGIMFGIFDVGRYAIMTNSLQTLADATARRVMINCINWEVSHGPGLPACTAAGGVANLPSNGGTSGHPHDPFSPAAKQTIAPFLYVGGLTPDVTVVPGTNVITVTASLPNFSMMIPFVWSGTSLSTIAAAGPSRSITVTY